MKKIISLLIAVTMLLTTVTFAENSQGNVEINFSIGDSVISINGKDVEVPAPFIQGEGTTMVPLRVITEAFGAKVDWNGTERKITIDYPDVKIIMVIGSKSVLVNDHSEPLSEAPVILGTGTTMVPLRFISETFGADVSWDQETKGVKVTKAVIDNESQTVQTSFDKKYITDSYYGWSINTPSLQMTEMSDDRRSIMFGDVENGLSIDIYEVEEVTLEKEFAYAKLMFAGMTVSKAQIAKNSAGEDYAIISAKDDSYYLTECIYVKDNFVYYIITGVSVDNKKEHDNNVLCAETFTFKTMTSDATDISNVKNGMRKYENKDLGIGFFAPAEWISDMPGTTMYVESENGSQITTYIFSKSDDVTAQTSAQRDRDRQYNEYNSKYATVSQVENIVIDGKQAYYYNIQIEGTKYSDMNMYDYFIENGDYINNFTIKIYDEDKVDIEKIIASISITDIDYEEVGNVLRDTYEDNTILDYTVGDMKIGFTNAWIVDAEDAVLIATNVHNGSVITIYEYSNSEKYSAHNVANELYASMINNDGITGVMAPKPTKLGGTSCTMFKLKSDDGEVLITENIYIFNRGGNIYVLSVLCSEEYDENKLTYELETAMKGIKWK